jgi:hypothetical protein
MWLRSYGRRSLHSKIPKEKEKEPLLALLWRLGEERLIG